MKKLLFLIGACYFSSVLTSINQADYLQKRAQQHQKDQILAQVIRNAIVSNPGKADKEIMDTVNDRIAYRDSLLGNNDRGVSCVVSFQEARSLLYNYGSHGEHAELFKIKDRSNHPKFQVMTEFGSLFEFTAKDNGKYKKEMIYNED